MKLFCVECDKKVEPKLVTGADVYPHRADLSELPFWKCETCGNFVGTHHKTDNPTKPLGVIASPNLKKIRMEIHSKLDPLWRNGRYDRKELYKMLSNELGRKYHTADLSNLREATEILLFVEDLAPNQPTKDNKEQL